MITPDELSKIVELANSVPDEYRQKCFEILLEYSLKQTLAAQNPPVVEKEKNLPGEKSKFILPIDVKAFLRQYGLEESIVSKYFYIEGDEVRHTYKLTDTKKIDKQTHHALMMCLENAIVNGEFKVNIESLRSRCKEYTDYDKPNFKDNIADHADFFKVEDEIIFLTPDGKSELADLLEQLGKNE